MDVGESSLMEGEDEKKARIPGGRRGVLEPLTPPSCWRLERSSGPRG